MNGNRDKGVLIHIIQYCNQIAEAIDIFGNDYGTFVSSNTYRNACCLCLLQIGELVGTLSDSFLAAHKQIPWRQIKGFRNIVAHAYGTIEPAVVWDIISNDLSPLKEYCQACLVEFQRQE